MENKQKLSEKENNDQNTPMYYKLEDMIEINIVGDGNCFFRCLSQVIDNTQENYHYYRILIYNYIYHNKEHMKNFFPINEKESDNDYNNRYLAFINTIKNNYNYAGDFELAAAAIVLHRKIIVYRNNFNGYEFLNEYNTTKENNEPITLVFKNNNHFNILVKKEKENEINFYPEEIRNFDYIHKKIEKSIKNLNLNDVKKISFTNVFDKIYVSYKRPECTNLYNEIYEFLKKEELPDRLNSQFMKNLKIYKEKKEKGDSDYNEYNPFIKKNNDKQDDSKKEKRKYFKDIISKKYFIREDRLYYKYGKNSKNIYEKKIPYKFEVPLIFYNAHINKIHFSINKSKENLFLSDFYYEGITKDFLSYINNCPICSNTKKIKKITMPKKLIIEEGPHFRYQMDIWYLPKDIAESSNYNYVLDIIDHFSKWLFSYPLKEKTGKEVLLNLRKYLISFGICKKLQTDNGLEFKNVLINNFCIDNQIERIFSPPYTPEANGCIESAHKIVQKFVNSYYYTKSKDEFSLEEAIIDAVEFHNNNKHTSTQYTPSFLKDCTEDNIIEEVKSNILKNVGKKIEKNNQNLLNSDDKLLLNSNIYINKKKKKLL